MSDDPSPCSTASRWSSCLPLVVAICGAPAIAQSYQSMIDTREGAAPYSSIFQIEAGAIGTAANGGSRNAARGLEDDISWDGKVYYRDEKFGSRQSTIEAYAGRDGLFAGFVDGKLIGDDTLTRLELRARPWMFYRDGSYRDGGALVPETGYFEGSEYEAYLGFGRAAQDGLYIEFGPYYRDHSFERSDLTPDASIYALPEDFAAYGARLYLEQRQVRLDRRRGTPLEGFVLTLVGEREWNDSKEQFGQLNLNETRLPDAVWRARGRLEWYIPSSDTSVFEVFAHGGWHDERDRIQNIDGMRPLGFQWGDGQLRWRIHFGDWLVLTPFGHLQYSRLENADGSGSDDDLFFGGGLDTYVHFGQSLSLHGWYSYLDNENRPSIRIDQDVRGEHMFYLGMVLRLGTSR